MVWRRRRRRGVGRRDVDATDCELRSPSVVQCSMQYLSIDNVIYALGLGSKSIRLVNDDILSSDNHGKLEKNTFINLLYPLALNIISLCTYSWSRVARHTCVSEALCQSALNENSLRAIHLTIQCSKRIKIKTLLDSFIIAMSEISCNGVDIAFVRYSSMVF